MFKVKVNQDIIQYCKNQVDKYNFGKRSSANGNKEQQLTGIIGQSVVMNLFGLGNVNGEDGFDDGVDILYNNKKIDVKTMGRKSDVKQNYTNNFLKLQDHYSTEIYIFCSYHKIKEELTICGWIEKQDFINKRRYYPKGTERKRFDGTTFETFADLYEIDNKDLNQVNNIDELKQQLKTKTMITYEKISDVHYKAYKHELFLNSIEIHSDKYVIVNRYSRLDVPKHLKDYLPYLILDTYKQDLKTYNLREYSSSQPEGTLSIKKMLNKLKNEVQKL
mgnify:FL=1|tara:strand:+ start:1801 stop:2628 length:828 start_codon:yes stop_codon:yes gene_type:complete